MWQYLTGTLCLIDAERLRLHCLFPVTHCTRVVDKDAGGRLSLRGVVCLEPAIDTGHKSFEYFHASSPSDCC